MLQTYGWNRFNPNYAIYVQPLHVKETRAASGVGGGDSGSLGSYESELDASFDDEDGGMPLDGFFADEDDEDTKRSKLTDEQKMLCTPLVQGYAFKEKMWLNFFVSVFPPVLQCTFADRVQLQQCSAGYRLQRECF